MTRIFSPGKGVHFLFALLIVAVIATIFWTQSRYPALDEKAMMSGAIQLEDPLGFEAKFPISPDMGLSKRIGLSTLNWINTNKKGMTFGVLFAAAFLTLFGYVRRRSLQGGFSNSLLGMFIGAPLGVCVNCAAPIAKGFYSSGLRAETTLSAMVASPTLNVVVLTMLFSLLPVYMAVTKIVLSIFIILIAVPIICRMLPEEQRMNTGPASTASVSPAPWDLQGDFGSGPLGAVLSVVISFGRNLWYIVRMTVPLMMFAGFLGALFASLLPQDLIMQASFGILAVVALALVCTFLPVPIAFDVVVAGALLSAGLNSGFVMTAVFTLGIFSVYSWMVVAQAISFRAATLLGTTVVVLGILAGLGANSYHNWQTKRALELLTAWDFSLIPAARADTPDVTVTSRPFAPRGPANDAGKPFSRFEAWKIGIDKPVEFSMADMWPPFWEGRSLSTGDIDQDGDPDLVIASTEKGLYTYFNDGQGRFSGGAIADGHLQDMPVFNAALVDLDNDGWLDLFVTTFRQGNYLVRNNAGAFDLAAPQPVANRDGAILSLALSFGDVNADGALDVALGNWAAGWYRRVPGEESRNRVIFGGTAPLGEEFIDLPGIPGETLSILLSDMNADGRADLIVGNDFEIPDYFYLGTATEGLKMVEFGDGLIPHSTTTTMAVKVADLHNDGVPETYLAQIAGRSSGVSRILKMQPLEKYCDGIESDEARATCETNMAIKRWYKSGNNFDPTYAGRCAKLSGRYQAECKATLVKDLAIQQRDPSICALISADQPRVRALCDVHFQPIHKMTRAEADAALKQVLRSNVLLQTNPDGGWDDLASEQGLAVGGWSWDTKIGDFDNDGFQDVYIVNGTWVPNEVSPSNLFFRNNGDGTFTEASGPFGLEDYLMTAAATAFDMDGDGDLDLISQPVNGPVAVFRNDGQAGNAVIVALDDRKGNSHGIGARLTAELADGTMMTREVQSGGGFMSFDAPEVHFGLGDAAAVARLTIRWADGGESVIDGGLPAGWRYVVTRN